MFKKLLYILLLCIALGGIALAEEVLRCDICKEDIYGSRFWECEEYWPGSIRYPQHICFECIKDLWLLKGGSKLELGISDRDSDSDIPLGIR